MLAWLEGGGRADATYETDKVSGLTLLMGAAVEGHERVVDLLLRHGAEISLQSSNGLTALMYAALHGHERVIELLIRHGAEINQRNRQRPQRADARRPQRPRAGGRLADSARR